jgi:hypothetical protein
LKYKEQDKEPSLREGYFMSIGSTSRKKHRNHKPMTKENDYYWEEFELEWLKK